MPNDRVLSRLAAAQWWGNQVLPATASDVWVTDGLARYVKQCTPSNPPASPAFTWPLTISP
jgi:hypothetical protein